MIHHSLRHKLLLMVYKRWNLSRVNNLWRLCYSKLLVLDWVLSYKHLPYRPKTPSKSVLIRSSMSYWRARMFAGSSTLRVLLEVLIRLVDLI